MKNPGGGGEAHTDDSFFFFFWRHICYMYVLSLFKYNTYIHIQPSLPGPFLVHTLLCIKIIVLQKRSENKSLPGGFFFF